MEYHFEKELSNYYVAIGRSLKNSFKVEDRFGKDLYSMARESIVNGGKKIRPILVLLSCEAVSKSNDYKLALPAAIIYELSHTAALIQDDTLDKATFRRKRNPGLWNTQRAWLRRYPLKEEGI